MSDTRIVRKLSLVGIWGNVLLSVFKLYAGVAGHSRAMVSDAVHSLSDVFATLVAWLGVRIAGRSPDREHPYGHERFECVASLLLGLILAVTGLGIGWSGIQRLLDGTAGTAQIPSILPLTAAAISIAVKEGMYHYTMHHANKLDSAAFRADAWHHRSDAFSSIGSFLGIGAARLGFPIMDSVAGLLICACILKVAYDILKDALGKLLDTSCGDELEGPLREYIIAQPGVVGLDLLQTRRFSNKVYADIEISADRSLSLVEAHAIAERVHHGIETTFPTIKHVTVHVNPSEEHL